MSDEPSSSIKDDRHDCRSGKTVRNWYWQKKRSNKDNEIEFRRKNFSDLTQFDVNFDIIPDKACSTRKLFSEVDYESAVQFLEENSMSNHKNEMYTVYVVSVIGRFERYDIKKSKFIFDIKDEDGNDYSRLGLTVEYKISNKHDTKYFNDKNYTHHGDRWGNHNGYPEKFGRKYPRNMKPNIDDE